MSGLPASASVLDALNKTSSAEDFFKLLGVDYDEKIVNVARLHILRKMAQYLASENFEGMSDEDITERCKAVLERAYADFVTSKPLDHRVFKVLKEAVAPVSKPKNLVSLNVLK